ncbi:hypothetical protein [Oligella urethralis]|uniref:hypothetical protein n=1 Tax=Oligella urethralis TaxID=90245 RepID=UPI000660AA6E|nr:hypothetical protein [Oligella urethralis]
MKDFIMDIRTPKGLKRVNLSNIGSYAELRAYIKDQFDTENLIVDFLPSPWFEEFVDENTEDLDPLIFEFLKLSEYEQEVVFDYWELTLGKESETLEDFKQELDFILNTLHLGTYEHPHYLLADIIERRLGDEAYYEVCSYINYRKAQIEYEHLYVNYGWNYFRRADLIDTDGLGK